MSTVGKQVFTTLESDGTLTVETWHLAKWAARQKFRVLIAKANRHEFECKTLFGREGENLTDKGGNRCAVQNHNALSENSLEHSFSTETTTSTQIMRNSSKVNLAGPVL